MDEKKIKEKLEDMKKKGTEAFMGLLFIFLVCYFAFFYDYSKTSLEEIPTPPVKENYATSFHYFFNFLDKDECFANVYATIPWDTHWNNLLLGRWGRIYGVEYINKRIFRASEVYNKHGLEIDIITDASYTPEESEILYQFYAKEIEKFIIQRELWGFYQSVRSVMSLGKNNPEIKGKSFEDVMKYWIDRYKKTDVSENEKVQKTLESPFESLLKRTKKTEQEFLDAIRELHRKVESGEGGYILSEDEKGNFHIACASNKK